ncbi:hypothetical protein MRX96_057409 [Rhipicephalus microplus]
MGPMAVGPVVINPMGPLIGGSIASKPFPVVLTDGSGEKKVVGTSNALTGVVSLNANKLKDALGQETGDEPPPPPEIDDEPPKPDDEEDPEADEELEADEETEAAEEPEADEEPEESDDGDSEDAREAGSPAKK